MQSSDLNADVILNGGLLAHHVVVVLVCCRLLELLSGVGAVPCVGPGLKPCILCFFVMFSFPWQPKGDFKNGLIAIKPSIGLIYLCAKFQCSDSKSSENSQN